ncbi:antitoxin VapB family protein [Promethearchaeum syntrophicum]|uniref:Antitoxin VapB family protein n=1 Tax=Promethearchaeum syntrophicum TaxID=2594042 RepID=A0A5B9DA60_9ARCH|nr:antitoxin VapB family protein [Candidatus Prometheoarchaeum syntrophicum]QEE16119.1 hypothetical protein DSAG12_01948 [Candidatus Prometheoarchaeum syntrophicum]
MASQQISIKQDVYNRLKKAKKTNESFSDIIERLLDNTSNVEKILSFYGAAKSDDPEYEKFAIETYAESRKQMQKSFNTRINGEN